MTYMFKCIYCGEKREIEKGMNEPFPEILLCSKGHMLYRDYSGEASGGKSVIIPENMRATSKGN